MLWVISYGRKEINMKSSAAVYGGGFSFSGVLTIVFIVLKLCNVIDWSWVWVLSPIWISFIISIILIICVVIIYKKVWK